MKRLICYNFAIDERACALWSPDLVSDTRQFIDSFDIAFYRHVVLSQTDLLQDEERGQYAALTIRLAYGHALETFFALLAAAVQAPQCPLGWVLGYQTPELRSVIRKLQDGDLRYSRLGKLPTFADLARRIHDPVRIAWGPKADGHVQAFTKAWLNLSIDFLNEAGRDEFNSLKHGLRASAGGFSFQMSADDDPDGREPIIDSRSDYGTQYFRRAPFDKHNFGARLAARNWSPAALVANVNVLTASINNVLSFLKSVNGTAHEHLYFMNPSAGSDAIPKPWEGTFMMATVERRGYRTEDVELRTKEQILGTYVDHVASPDSP